MPTATATVSGHTLATATSWENVENNVYFPPDTVEKSGFSPSKTHTTCGWKGVASYYDLTIDGNTIKDAAWYYPEPKDGAKNIKDYVAFYKNKVQVNVS